MYDILEAGVVSIRNRLTSRGKGRGSDGETIEDGDGDAVRAADGRGSRLYQCPACETVFVATDKRVCGSCGTDVEQVPSTLREP